MTDARHLIPRAMDRLTETCAELDAAGIPPQVITIAMIQILTLAWARESGMPPIEDRRQLADAIIQFGKPTLTPIQQAD